MTHRSRVFELGKEKKLKSLKEDKSLSPREFALLCMCENALRKNINVKKQIEFMSKSAKF